MFGSWNKQDITKEITPIKILNIWKGPTLVFLFRNLPSSYSFEFFWVENPPYFKRRFHCWRPKKKTYFHNISTLIGFFLRRNLKIGRDQPFVLHYTLPLVLTLGGPPHDNLLVEYKLIPLTSLFPIILQIWSLICLRLLPQNK